MDFDHWDRLYPSLHQMFGYSVIKSDHSVIVLLRNQSCNICIGDHSSLA